jgi:hypothetical protein
MKQMSILTNKKGFELSINFIVMLIITLIVFGGTLAIAYKLLKSTGDLKASMDKQTEERLELMITNSNEEVVIAFNQKEVQGGEAAVFGLGVTNMLNSRKNFSVTITPSTAINKDGSEVYGWTDRWIYVSNDDIGEIKNNDHKIKSIVIIPPKDAAPGVTYVFNVNVFYKSGATDIAYPLKEPTKKVRVMII